MSCPAPTAIYYSLESKPRILTNDAFILYHCETLVIKWHPSLTWGSSWPKTNLQVSVGLVG